MADSRSRAMRRIAVGALLFALFIGPAQAVRADEVGGIMAAFSDIFSGVMAIPMGIIGGTFGGPPIIGTVGGAMMGAVNTLSYTLRGVLRLVGVAIPLATKAAPYLPLLL